MVLTETSHFLGLQFGGLTRWLCVPPREHAVASASGGGGGGYLDVQLRETPTHNHGFDKRDNLCVYPQARSLTILISRQSYPTEGGRVDEQNG